MVKLSTGCNQKGSWCGEGRTAAAVEVACLALALAGTLEQTLLEPREMGVEPQTLAALKSWDGPGATYSYNR